MTYTSLADRCTHCGERVTTTFRYVTVVYHATDRELDRYQWQHGDCGLVIKPYDDIAREAFAEFVGGDQIRARFRDSEFDDPKRISDAAPFTSADLASLIAWLRNIPSA